MSSERYKDVRAAMARAAEVRARACGERHGPDAYNEMGSSSLKIPPEQGINEDSVYHKQGDHGFGLLTSAPTDAPEDEELKALIAKMVADAAPTPSEH